MTTKSLMISCTPANSGENFGTSYTSFGCSVVTVAENIVGFPCLTAFTLSLIGALASFNNASGAVTYKSRVNGANGNCTFIIPTNTMGWFSDVTHSDSVTSGQTFNLQRNSLNASTFNPKLTIVTGVASASSPLMPQIIADGTGHGGQFQPPFGGFNLNGVSEAIAQEVVSAAATWKGFGLRTAAVAGSTTTATSRKNGAGGNQAVVVTNGTASGTNLQDTTHTDSIAAGDNIATSLPGPNFAIIYSEFAGTISAHNNGTMFQTSAGVSMTASTTRYWNYAGQVIDSSATEAGVMQLTLPYALTFSQLRTRISSNTAMTGTCTSRKNAADGNCVVSVTSGGTGEFSDVTHSDSCASSDLIDAKFVTGSGTSMGFASLRGQFDDGSVSAAVNYTLTAVQGSYSVTGQAVAFHQGPKITAVQGSYTLTGKTAILTSVRTMPAAKGTYALTGEAAGFVHGPKVTADQGSYSLSGQAAGLFKHLSLTAVRGLYTLLGEDVSHIADLSVSASAGFYHLLGEDVLGGRTVILKAHRGRYRLHKEKTVLRGPTSTRTIWPVDAGDYVLDGQDVIFGQEHFRVTFSGFVNPTYLDWDSLGGSDYESRLHTNYVIPSDAMAWAQVPYLYVFVADTGTDSGLFLNVVRNWAEAGNTPQIGDPIQVYRSRDGYLMSVTKNRINGRGRAMQLQYKSETGKAFNIRGWAMWIEKNSKV